MCMCTALLGWCVRALRSILSQVKLDRSSDVPVTEQLRDILSANAVRVIDLFRDWDDDGNVSINCTTQEFRLWNPRDCVDCVDCQRVWACIDVYTSLRLALS